MGIQYLIFKVGQFSHYERYKRLNFSNSTWAKLFTSQQQNYYCLPYKLYLPVINRTDMINIVLSICCLSIRMIDLFVIHSLHLSEIKLSYFKHVFNPSFFLSAIFVQTRLETSRS